MEQKKYQNNSQAEPIDLLEILTVLKQRLVWIVIAALGVGFCAYLYTAYYVTPMYQASIQMIVNTKKDAYTTITVNDVSNAENLVNTYATVIKSNRVMDRVIETLDLDMTWSQLNGMVSVHSVDDTPVMNIVVTSSDPQLAREIVTTISEVSPELIVDAVEAGSCKVISDAYCSGAPVSPNIKDKTMKGIAAGAVGSAVLFILMYLLNDVIESEEQLAEISGVPVMGIIPHSDMSWKKGKHDRRHRK